MSDKKVWQKFYPQDWKGDEGLQMCSLAARGLWMEMLCIMWGNGGYLKIGDNPLDEMHLTRTTGADIDQIRSLLHELENFGVLSRNRNGVIYSRRIVKEEIIGRKNRENGKKGGAAKHLKNKAPQNLGNRNPSETPSPRDQRPETRKNITPSVSPPTDEKLPKEEDYFWDGKIIKLNRRDFDRWLEMSGLPDKYALDKVLDDRDEWLAENPERAARWFVTTAKYLQSFKDGGRTD